MAFKLLYDTTVGTSPYIQPATNWTGAADANWSAITCFELLAYTNAPIIFGISGSTSTRIVRVETNGALNWVTVGIVSAAGLVPLNTKIWVKAESVGTLKILSYSFDGINYTQVGSATYSASSFAINRIGSSATAYRPYFIFYSLEFVGGTYSDKWDATTSPGTGTQWHSPNGRQLSLAGFSGTTDSWWVFYEADITGDLNYYLDYVQAASKFMTTMQNAVPASIAAGQNFKLTFEIKIGTGSHRFLGRAGASSSVRFNNLTTMEVVGATGTPMQFSIAANDTDFRKFEIWRTDGANINVRVDNGNIMTAAYSGDFIFGRMYADVAGVSASSGQCKYIQLEKDGVTTNLWKNTIGTGGIFPDVIGGNHFVQTGTWPADNSEWVEYQVNTITYSQVKVWNGTQFVVKNIMRWNGVAFVPVDIKRWDGTSWVLV